FSTNLAGGENTLFSTRMESIVDDIVFSCLVKTWTSRCRTQVAIHDFGLLLELLRRSSKNNMTRIEQIATTCHGQGGRNVLFDHDDGAALARQFLADIHQVTHDQRRQAFKGFVKKDQLGIAN